MSKKVEVVICLGSSCFARGNKNLLKVITQYIKDNNIQDRVNFHGGHCFGNCVDGPTLKIGGTIHTHIDEFKTIEILNSIFQP
ncbi:MAG: (2Fe-2S) ferredoxin domain-containing protein [Bacteroidales bacterium]|nr:(2Fe-2S) ferredoxin domain-containing protein [Tenuifilaceae bacterium]